MFWEAENTVVFMLNQSDFIFLFFFQIRPATLSTKTQKLYKNFISYGISKIFENFKYLKILNFSHFSFRFFSVKHKILKYLESAGWELSEKYNHALIRWKLGLTTKTTVPPLTPVTKPTVTLSNLSLII